MAIPLDCWKLDSSRLYPTGLASYSIESKCVIVVWAEHTVQSLLFEKGFSTAVTYNLPPTKKFKPHAISESVIDLVIGTQETIILTEDGTVKRFSSNKRVITIEHLKGVRCACRTQQQGFAMICLSPDGKQINLQMHPASLATSNSASLTFDLNFLQNYCQSTWTDSIFVIKEMVFTNPNRYFWKSLRIETTKIISNFIFFSVDNVLFVLVEQDDGVNYNAHIVETCSSNIINFWQSRDEEAMYVLLESGTMVVLFPNTNLRCVRLRSYLYFGNKILCGQVIDDVFVYSDGVEIVQTSICKSEFSYTTLHGSSTEIYGVSAFTFLPTEKKILAITENRKFFTIAYRNARKHIDRFLEDLVFVDEQLLVEAKTEIVDLVELNCAHEKVQAQISRQTRRMRAIAAVQNALPVKLNVYLTRYMPKIDSRLIVSSWDEPQTERTTGSNYFVHIQVTPTNVPLDDGVDLLGFTSHDWQLAIHGSHMDCRCIRIFKNNFKEPVHLVYRLNFGSFQMPTLHIFIRNIGYHNFSMSYPIDVQPICTHDLMTVYKKEPATVCGSLSEEKDEDLVLYKLRIPANVSFMDIKSFFETEDTEIDASANCIFITVVDYHIVQLIIDAERVVTFRSDSSDAMFCVKHYVLLRLQQKLSQPVRTHRKEVLEEMKVNFI